MATQVAMKVSLVGKASPTLASRRGDRAAKLAAKPFMAGSNRVASVKMAPVTASRSMKVMAASTDEIAKQMDLNQKRWDAQVREGRVKSVSNSEVAKLVANGYVLLDVRPPTEVAKAQPLNSINVPLFVEDQDRSFSGLMKQASAFGMGGWWLGGTHMIPNPQFLPEVLNKIPNKDTPIVVACQKGLRSLASCEQLARAGYTNLTWLTGGFDTVRKEDGLATKDDLDMRYGGIGGVSAMVGWTPVQQEQDKGLNPAKLIRIAAVVLLLDGLVVGYDVWNAYSSVWFPK